MTIRHSDFKLKSATEGVSTIALWQNYIALIFSCFILGWAFFFSLLFSLSSIFLCLSGSSISLKHQTISSVDHYLRASYLILSLISRFFFSLSSAAFSAFTAWIDFQ